MSEEFRGHLEDCVHDLNARLESRHPKGSKKAAHARQPIADFCGVKPKTVTRWLHSAESLPNGLQLIKLMCFLELLGYRVIEWERIPTARRNFTELVGFGLLSIEQSLELLGYSNTTTVYQVLLGHYGPSKDKDRIIWETWKAGREKLDQAKVNARKIYCLDLPSKRRPRTETQGQDPQAISPKRFTAMIYIMEALIALLEDEHSTSSELDSVNVPSLTETIVKLLNLLNDKNAKLKGDS